MRLSDPQRNVCIKVERAKATVEKRVEDGEREGRTDDKRRERGSWETLDSKENEREPWSTAGSLRGIMTVILRSISSCSAQTA